MVAVSRAGVTAAAGEEVTEAALIAQRAQRALRAADELYLLESGGPGAQLVVHKAHLIQALREASIGDEVLPSVLVLLSRDLSASNLESGLKAKVARLILAIANKDTAATDEALSKLFQDNGFAHQVHSDNLPYKVLGRYIQERYPQFRAVIAMQEAPSAGEVSRWEAIVEAGADPVRPLSRRKAPKKAKGGEPPVKTVIKPAVPYRFNRNGESGF